MSTQIPNLAHLLGPSPHEVGGRPEPNESEIDVFAQVGESLMIFQMEPHDAIKGAGGSTLAELIGPIRFDVDDFARQAESNLRFLQEKLSRVPKEVADAVLVDPRVMHGNPVFRGTRIPLYQIVEELADGTPFEELAEGYPSLEPDKIRLALDFVASLLRIYDEKVSDR